MYKINLVYAWTFLASVVCALPSSKDSFLTRRSSSTSAEDIILAIAPSSSSCSGADFTDECATAATAASYLITAMASYSIYSTAEIAALLSVMAYETGEFKYNINHYPGRAGQGTRNMQMANYNLLYAQSISALSSSLSAITTASSIDGLTDDQLNSIRALVLPDEYSFASAAWFLTTQCSDDVRTQLQTGSQAGYETYLSSCIGTSATDDRLAYWTAAIQAFGISS